MFYMLTKKKTHCDTSLPGLYITLHTHQDSSLPVSPTGAELSPSLGMDGKGNPSSTIPSSSSTGRPGKSNTKPLKGLFGMSLKHPTFTALVGTPVRGGLVQVFPRPQTVRGRRQVHGRRLRAAAHGVALLLCGGRGGGPRRAGAAAGSEEAAWMKRGGLGGRTRHRGTERRGGGDVMGELGGLWGIWNETAESFGGNWRIDYLENNDLHTCAWRPNRSRFVRFLIGHSRRKCSRLFQQMCGCSRRVLRLEAKKQLVYIYIYTAVSHRGIGSHVELAVCCLTLVRVHRTRCFLMDEHPFSGSASAFFQSLCPMRHVRANRPVRQEGDMRNDLCFPGGNGPISLAPERRSPRSRVLFDRTVDGGCQDEFTVAARNSECPVRNLLERRLSR